MAHEPDPGPDHASDPEFDGTRVEQASDVLLAVLRPIVLDAGGVLDLEELERQADELFEPLAADRPTSVLAETMRSGRRALMLLPRLDDDGTASKPARNRVADVETLTERLVLTHRLTDAELSSGRLDLCIDLGALVYAAEIHGGLHSPDGNPLRLRERRVEGGGRAGDMLHTVHLEGVDGWLSGYMPGQLVQARAVEGILTLEVLSDDDVAPAPENCSAVLVQIRGAFNEGDGFPVDAAEIQFALAVDHPDWFVSPLPPLGELVAEAGLETDGTSVGRPGGWEAWRQLNEAVRQLMSHQLPEELAGDLPKLVGAFLSWREGTEPSRAVAPQLHRDWPLLWPLEEELRRQGASPEEIERFAEAIGERAGPQSKAAARWLAARAAVLAGEATRAEELVQDALAADPEFLPAHEEAAAYASDRSRARQAVNHLHRVRPDNDDELVRLRELAGAASPRIGRNDRCPCGSGRKFKQCHLARWEVPEGDRVRWLLEKARGHTLRAVPPGLVHNLTSVGGRRLEAKAVGLDLLMFDEAWFGRFLQDRGPLLSEWERAVGQSWVTGHRSSVFRVDALAPDGARTLTDAATGETYEVMFSPALDVADRDRVVWCRLVPVGTGWYATGIILVTRLAERARLLAAVAGPAQPEDRLEELLAAKGGTERDPAGRPLVECWSSFSADSLDGEGAAAGLDRVLRRHTPVDDADYDPDSSARVAGMLGGSFHFSQGIYESSGWRGTDGELVDSVDELCEWHLTRESRGLESGVVGRVKSVGKNRWEAQAETVAHYEELTRALVEAVGELTVHEERRAPFARARALFRLDDHAGALIDELDEMAELPEVSDLGELGWAPDDEGLRAVREEPDEPARFETEREQLEAETDRLQAELEELEEENARLLKAAEEIRDLWADTPARDLGNRSPREAVVDDKLRPDVLTMIAELHPDDDEQAAALRSVLGMGPP